MAIVLEGHIKVPVDELETIKNNLNEHIQNTLNKDGCLEFTVEQDGIDECIFNVFEKFRDSGAFDAHQQRVRTSYWGAITKNVKRVYRKNSR